MTAHVSRTGIHATGAIVRNRNWPHRYGTSHTAPLDAQLLPLAHPDGQEGTGTAGGATVMPRHRAAAARGVGTSEDTS